METSNQVTIELTKEEYSNFYLLHLQVNDLIEMGLTTDELVGLPRKLGAQLLKIVKTNASIKR